MHIEPLTTTKKKTRLIVQKGIESVALRTADIVLIYRSEDIVLVVDRSGNKYVYNRTLFHLAVELDEATFFRVNRKYIVNVNFLRGFKTLDRVKLDVSLLPPFDQYKIVVSQETAPYFKRWLEHL